MYEKIGDRQNAEEAHYEKERDILLKNTALENYLDDPYLFMRRQKFSDHLVRFKVFEKILNSAGCIVECGVKRGGSLMLFSLLSQALEPYNHLRKIYGFDTFEGFRSINQKKDLGRCNEKMFSDVDVTILEKAIALQDRNRPLGHLSKVELIKGDATKTIPEFVKEHPELVISLLYIDFDIYEPTKVAIEHLLPLVPKGGLVVFDEFSDERWPGETSAVKEMLDLKNLKLNRFPFSPLPAYFVVGE